MPDTAKIIQFRTLVHRLHIDEDTMRDMIFNVSDGKYTSTRELNNQQITGLINRLNDVQGSAKSKESDQKNRLRRKILSLMYTMGENDLPTIKELVKKHWGKAFNEYNVKELRKIIAVLERKWLPFYLKKNI